jgi:ADP-heptose:LPS heptosyltransferase
LAQIPSYQILLFGGGKKKLRTFEFAFQIQTKCNCCSRKNKFEQELQLISNLDVMLSMDSGNAHIAAMLV